MILLKQYEERIGVDPIGQIIHNLLGEQMDDLSDYSQSKSVSPRPEMNIQQTKVPPLKL